MGTESAQRMESAEGTESAQGTGSVQRTGSTSGTRQGARSVAYVAGPGATRPGNARARRTGSPCAPGLAQARAKALPAHPAARRAAALISFVLCLLTLALPRPAMAEEAAVRKVAAPAIVRYVVREDEDSNWYTIADWPQGADIPFMLVGTLPEDLAERKALAYCLVAAPGEGLTYLDGSARVTLVHASGATEDITSALEVAWEDGELSAGSKDIKQAVPGLVATDTLRLTYNARLNDAAQIGLETGNESWAHLEYTEGAVAEDTANVLSDIATKRIYDFRRLLAAATVRASWRQGLSLSPQIKTSVYTYSLKVEKVDEATGKPLAGATFALRDADGLWYRAAATGEADPTDDAWVADAANATTRTTAADGTASFDFVDSVRYELVELEAPEGYLKVDPVDVTLEAGGAGSATTLAARSEAGEVRSVDAGAGIVRLRVADPVDAGDPGAGGSGSRSGAGRNSGLSSLLARGGGLLSKTADAALSVWPVILISVLALLCGLALRRGRGRRNTH